MDSVIVGTRESRRTGRYPDGREIRANPLLGLPLASCQNQAHTRLMAIPFRRLNRVDVAGIADTINCRGWTGSGAEGQNRTVDTSLFRAVLCQLSYLGTW